MCSFFLFFNFFLYDSAICNIDSNHEAQIFLYLCIERTISVLRIRFRAMNINQLKQDAVKLIP